MLITSQIMIFSSQRSKTELVRYPAGKKEDTYTIPQQVTHIEGPAFSGCSALSQSFAESTTTKINGIALSGCTGLTSGKYGPLEWVRDKESDSLTFSNDGTLHPLSWLAQAFEAKSIIIGAGVTILETNALKDFTSVEDMTFTDSVETLKSGALPNLSNLKSITLGSDVSEIEPSAFSGCVSLATISLSDGNESFMLDNGVLYTKNKDAIVLYPSGKTEDTFTILSGVKTIRSYASEKAQNVIIVKIPESVEEIQDNAFSECEELKKLEFYGIIPPECSKDAFDTSNIRVVVPQAYDGDTFCSTAPDKTLDKETNSVNIGIIIGIIIGVIAVVSIVIVSVFVWQRGRMKKK